MKHKDNQRLCLAASVLLGCWLVPPAAARAAEVASEGESTEAEATENLAPVESRGVLVEPGVAGEHEESGEHEEGRNVLSLKLAGLEIVVPGEAEEAGPLTGEGESTEDEVLRRVGVSIGYERVLIPGWLNAEINVLLAPGAGGVTLPIDLVLKKPFELSSRFEGVVGVGLATEWYEAGESETALGLSTQLGLEYWLDPHFGLVFDGEYNLLLSPETEHEFVLATGGAYRF
jgi:hypothetical protein